jgi:hypothetical protein
MKKISKLKVTIFIGVLVSILSFMLAGYFYFTAALVNTTDNFLQSLKNKSTDATTMYLSSDFRRHVTTSLFSEFINENELDSYVSASWDSRSLEGSRGSLVGVIQTNDKLLPATISLVKEDDGWKIYSLQIRDEQSHKNEETRQLPDQQTQLLLATDIMAIFTASLEQKSMQLLYESAAAIWQNNTSVNTLDEAFNRFYTENILMLNQINNKKPIFDHAAKLDDDGFMLMAGFYELEDQTLRFKQRYIYEGLAWKLVGLDVRLNKEKR